ncbi:radical S-adenosyl methionine domain-containing protein 1, mitochondrial-like [Lytechinus variegatus]|uniref:radical S-adenosyl methionine domain-containing protein 1, mitochondrial-like n=1 Tax=Lytechinus variegatus TaxID=7654 RepID=UPI001BB102D3|nr:radical S-adenosyl methionine domain-containing protein 1, mitochondrial-like [Lytechinus variegatus]XP_041485520.1 radical S-adenosyl methionine domain-containing protein 1, mitochondrial-like [Lytechinus variegatus]
MSSPGQFTPFSRNVTRLLNHMKWGSPVHYSIVTDRQYDKSRGKEFHFPPWLEEASIYVHWPYCKKRCTYCNFNKYVTPTIDQDRMRACLTREARTLIRLSGIKRVNSIFFGGGTPSLAEPRVLEGVIDAVREMVVMPTDVEITMEANPTSVEMKRLEDFKSAGINRLSLGIQALNNNDLRTLGREHTVDQSLTCIQEARTLFPDRLSIDIIFGRPSQTLNSWKAELDHILQVCDSHISLYQLTLEPGTLLYKLEKQGVLPMPDADVMADMYETAVERLDRAGLYRYEVSNFARDVRAESTHNKAYWEGKQYIGVGPGAHGRFCPVADQTESKRIISDSKAYFQSVPCHSKDGARERSLRSDGNLVKLSTATPRSRQPVAEETEQRESPSDSFPSLLQREARIQTLEPEAWMLEVEKYGHATRKRSTLFNIDTLRELLLTGLRTCRGISSQTWQQFSPEDHPRDVFGPSSFTKGAIISGLVELDDRGLRCTHHGLNVLDSILPELTEILDSHYDNVR